MAPLVAALKNSSTYRPYVLVTAQHREMLDQVMDIFDMRADEDLDLMEAGQTLDRLTGRAVAGVAACLRRLRPSALMVQGDTTTTFASALAAFYENVPVVHVEAGLRTGDVRSPFPEEMNRLLTSRMTQLHLPPTLRAAENLLVESYPANRICTTGNTVIDALLMTVEKKLPWSEPGLKDLFTRPTRKILVTTHRRESWGAPMREATSAILTILERTPDAEVIFPVHRNPIVREATAPLAHHARAHLVEPVGYGDFAKMMSESYFILTDSGGVQEEGPTLGKPVLVMRETTERPEAVTAGTARLVGTSYDRILKESTSLLEDDAAYGGMANATNPYGDGRAAERTIQALDYMFDIGPKPDDFAATDASGRTQEGRKNT